MNALNNFFAKSDPCDGYTFHEHAKCLYTVTKRVWYYITRYNLEHLVLQNTHKKTNI